MCSSVSSIDQACVAILTVLHNNDYDGKDDDCNIASPSSSNALTDLEHRLGLLQPPPPSDDNASSWSGRQRRRMRPPPPSGSLSIDMLASLLFTASSEEAAHSLPLPPSPSSSPSTISASSSNPLSLRRFHPTIRGVRLAHACIVSKFYDPSSPPPPSSSIDSLLTSLCHLVSPSHLSELERRCASTVSAVRSDTFYTSLSSGNVKSNPIAASTDLATAYDAELRNHADLVGQLFAYAYATIPTGRQQLRLAIGSALTEDRPRYRPRSNATAMKTTLHLRPLLNATSRIVHGMPNGEGRVLPQLLFDVLLPLHRPHTFVLWRDQTPTLSLYHEELVRAADAVLELHPDLTGKYLQGIFSDEHWSGEGSGRKGGRTSSSHQSANTPKLLLLLHEMEMLLRRLPGLGEGGGEQEEGKEVDADVAVALVARATECIRSDNFRTSERALGLWISSNEWNQLVKAHWKRVGPDVVLALCKDGRLSDAISWNPTVNRMTADVLQKVEEYEPDYFSELCEKLFSSSNKPGIIATESSSSPETVLQKDDTVAAHHGANVPISTSLLAGMGRWRPPSTSGKMRAAPLSRNKNQETPPLTLTGVAPWAMQRNPSSSSSSSSLQSKNPPLTVTGVAPWATAGRIPRPPRTGVFPKTSSFLPPSPAMRPPVRPPVQASAVNIPMDTSTAAEIPVQCPEKPTIPSSFHTSGLGMKRIREYVLRLCPKSKDSSHESSSLSTHSPSPVRLPSLRFHDLVFGHDLGQGAFGAVRYVRHVQHDGSGRSSWPEYAVKTISTTKMIEYGYATNVNREVAILNLLTHPCICRLVSSFKFRDGAYLVIEYAARGDLHSALGNAPRGKLEENAALFVLGEITSALTYVHEMGFVYGDLKPENVLIAAGGHIKLADFGAARAVTEEALQMLQDQGNVVDNLRNGDWKEADEMKSNAVNVEETTEGWSSNLNDNEIADDKDDTADAEEEDARIEGTAAYLPPEVAAGRPPTRSADVWALGIVLYQIVSGRLPILEDTDEETRDRVVHFAPCHTDLFSDKDNDNGGISIFSVECKDLLTSCLLVREEGARASLARVAEHAFFRGKDVHSLYKEEPHPIPSATGGASGPGGGGANKWKRRQFSSIWDPMPKKYALGIGGISGEGNGSKTGNGLGDSAITEGKVEKNACFLSSLFGAGREKTQFPSTCSSSNHQSHMVNIEENIHGHE